MTNKSFAKKLTQSILRRFAALCFFAVLFFVSSGIPQALADSGAIANLEKQNLLIARNPVEEAVDNLAGQGTTDQIQGQVDESTGRVQRELGKVTGQTEGALRETKGQAQQSLGETRRAVDKASDKAEYQLEKAGEKTEDASENLIDKIKNFFD
ncbi:MAG: CsbD family protein [Kastovskya adunca ATA6-11-RM4]|jgi:uncharacterized protein YjbJ (UPF0337 family)|nr:CsbD family protein [Kastovskya adunca ATA6-11-RM4]